MAAAVQSTVTGVWDGTTTVTFTGLAASAGNAVTVQMNARDNVGAAFSSATWNGGSVTPSEVVADAVVNGIQLITLSFTGLTGTHTLVVVLDSNMDDMAGWAHVISNADTSNVLGAAGYSAADNFDSPAAAPAASNADSRVLSQIRGRSDYTASMAVQAGQTGLAGPTLTGNGNTVMCSREAGAASVTSGYRF